MRSILTETSGVLVGIRGVVAAGLACPVDIHAEGDHQEEVGDEDSGDEPGMGGQH